MKLTEAQVRALIRHEAEQIIKLTHHDLSSVWPNSIANYREHGDRLRELVGALPEKSVDSQ